MSIDTLTQLQNDQMSSQFVTLFDSVPGSSLAVGPDDPLALRMDQQFEPPAQVSGSYETMFQGIKLIHPSSTQDTDKVFTLTFRNDQGWAIYDAFEAWSKSVFNESDGSTAPKSSIKTKLRIRALGPSKARAKDLVYDGVWVRSVKITTFDNASTDPIRIECEFVYDKFTTE